MLTLRLRDVRKSPVRLLENLLHRSDFFSQVLGPHPWLFDSRMLGCFPWPPHQMSCTLHTVSHGVFVGSPQYRHCLRLFLAFHFNPHGHPNYFHLETCRTKRPCITPQNRKFVPLSLHLDSLLCHVDTSAAMTRMISVFFFLGDTFSKTRQAAALHLTVRLTSGADRQRKGKSTTHETTSAC